MFYTGWAELMTTVFVKNFFQKRKNLVIKLDRYKKVEKKSLLSKPFNTELGCVNSLENEKREPGWHF